MKNAKRWLAVIVVAMLVVTFAVGLTACNKQKFDNEKTAFAMSIQNPDGVFNPFFSSSAYDSSIISLTQISMLNTDQVGNLVAGLDQPTVALAFDIDYTDSEGNSTSDTQAAINGYTDYRLLIKNGLKFSDGHDLTIKDVLFNLYVYLDPVFTGSATIYSTDIVGLNAYRTQNEDAGEELTQQFEDNFLNAAYTALEELTAWVTAYSPAGIDHDDITGFNDGWLDESGRLKAWDGDAEYISGRGSYIGNIKVTFESLRQKVNHIASLYHDELVSDWNAINMDDYESKKYDKDGNYVEANDTRFTEAWQVFLLNDMSNTDILMRENGADNDQGPYKRTDNSDYILHTGRAQKEFDDIVGDEIKSMLEGQDKQDAIRDAFINAQFTSVFGTTVKENKDSDGNISYEVSVPDMSYSSFSSVVNYWGTSSKVLDELIAEAKTLYFGKSDTLTVPNIAGITVEKVDSFTGKQSTADGAQDVTINGKHYVLNIRINKVDPKALMNFAFTVAPMHYYSSESEIEKFEDDWAKWEAAGAHPETFNDRQSGVTHFGVLYGNSNFMNDVVNAPSKIVKPLGAGAYQASNDAGEQDFDKVTGGGSTGFFNNNMVFYTRNNYFWTVGADGGTQESSKLQNAKIKTVVYKVVAADQIISSLKSGEIHFGDPSATQENVQDLMGAGLQVVRTLTSGYGYIGINPRYVPEYQVRQAIMKAMDIDGTMINDYYKNGFAERIYRPMSKASWAYPKSAHTYSWGPQSYQNLNYDENGTEIRMLVESAGYRLEGGLYRKGDKTLDFKFTIAGGSTDHPAYKCFLNAQRILNANGFNVQVVTSAQALSDLSAGKLAVWAAAWSSAIDPDMYQIYHINSQASSTSNWGYKQIKADTNTYGYEYNIIAGKGLDGQNSLSDLIDQARETNDQNTRAELYSQCLDCVMALAVELPTYQRYDITVYNNKVIDSKSLPRHQSGTNANDPTNSDIGPYYGLLSRIWEVSFV